MDDLELAPTLTTAPSGEVVTLDEAKAHLRVDDNDQDELIAAIRDAAVARLDGWSGILGRCLLTQTWTAYFRSFDGRLRLPLVPVSAISSVKYYNSNNTLTTISASVYSLLTDLRGVYVTPAWPNTWPSSLYDRDDPVAVAFAAGYANAAAVPAPIKQAIKLMIGNLFENRETVVVGAQVSTVPMSATVEALLAPYRAGSF